MRFDHREFRVSFSRSADVQKPPLRKKLRDAQVSPADPRGDGLFASPEKDSAAATLQDKAKAKEAAEEAAMTAIGFTMSLTFQDGAYYMLHMLRDFSLAVPRQSPRFYMLHVLHRFTCSICFWAQLGWPPCQASRSICSIMAGPPVPDWSPAAAAPPAAPAASSATTRRT